MQLLCYCILHCAFYILHFTLSISFMLSTFSMLILKVLMFNTFITIALCICTHSSFTRSSLTSHLHPFLVPYTNSSLHQLLIALTPPMFSPDPYYTFEVFHTLDPQDEIIDEINDPVFVENEVIDYDISNNYILYGYCDPLKSHNMPYRERVERWFHTIPIVNIDGELILQCYPADLPQSNDVFDTDNSFSDSFDYHDEWIFEHQLRLVSVFAMELYHKDPEPVVSGNNDLY